MRTSCVHSRGQLGEEILEPLRAEQKLANDQQRPALADDVEGPGDRAHLSVAAALHLDREYRIVVLLLYF